MGSLPNSNTNTLSTHSTATTSAISTTHSPPMPAGSEDQRKKQIRDSNREAARRCRERRRQYIEQLEGKLEQSKSEVKQLNEKLARTERENLRLRTMLAEANHVQTTGRLSAADIHSDYIINGVNLELTNETTDGTSIKRTYINRNNL
jgi:septal ring factor EnvC (AmiA/AmiB activator)